MNCPECGVRLYRTVSSAESKVYVTFERDMWLFAIGAAVLLFLATFILGMQDYFWVAFVVAMLGFAA